MDHLKLSPHKACASRQTRNWCR